MHSYHHYVLLIYVKNMVNKDYYLLIDVIVAINISLIIPVSSGYLLTNKTLYSSKEQLMSVFWYTLCWTLSSCCSTNINKCLLLKFQIRKHVF